MKQLTHFTLYAFVCLLFACTSKKQGDVSAPTQENHDKTALKLTDEQIKSSKIETGKPALREVSGTIKVNGVLDVPPQNLVSISAQLGGFVKHTDLLQGMKVHQGQVLATLEGQEYIQLQEDYLNSKTQLEFLRLDFQRQQELAKENVNAAKALQLAQSNFLGMRVKTEALTARLKLVHIKPEELETGSIQNTVSVISPISGFVSQVNVNLGMHVNPTDVMFRIIDTEHLHAEAQVFEKDIALLRIGQKVRVTLTNDTRERIATVYLIGKEVTPERTVRVHCHFEGEDPTLIPGMYFSAVIETGNHPVPTLPDASIVTFEGKKFVFAEQGHGHYRMTEIKTGAQQSGFTEVVLSDSLSSARIVVNGAYELLSRLKNSEE